MDLKEFKENLLIYGSDINRWPQNLSQEAWDALTTYADLQALVDEEKEFDYLLLAQDIESPAPHLAQRIIEASGVIKKKEQLSIRSFFEELFSELRIPQPALVTVIILLIGIVLGFSNPLDWGLTDQMQTQLYDFLYYEGDVL
jgi:hypothetical protein